MRELDETNYIRHKLFAGDLSPAQRYRSLVVGEESLGSFLRFEVLTSLLGGISGAAGLALRKLFYPSLFKEIGKGVVFGRNVVIRNPQGIRLGSRVVIDDNCVIDARGAGEDGLVVDDDVILNRGTMVLAKEGPVYIGKESDIGAGSYIVSQGGVSVGRQVAMGGGCKIGGGLIEMGRRGSAAATEGAERDQVKVTKGPVRIGDRSVFGGMVIVLDGVSVGAGCIIGAGAMIREDIPPGMLVAPRQDLVLLPRPGTTDPGGEEDLPSGRPSSQPAPRSSKSLPETDTDPRTVQAIFAAIEEVNRQLPPQDRLQQSLDAPLQANGGSVDSLVLINLLVASEERLAEAFGVHVVLTDRNLAAEGENPLATVGSLVRFVERARRNG